MCTCIHVYMYACIHVYMYTCAIQVYMYTCRNVAHCSVHQTIILYYNGTSDT